MQGPEPPCLLYALRPGVEASQGEKRTPALSCGLEAHTFTLFAFVFSLMNDFYQIIGGKLAFLWSLSPEKQSLSSFDPLYKTYTSCPLSTSWHLLPYWNFLEPLRSMHTSVVGSVVCISTILH